MKLTTLCYMEQEGNYLMLYRNKKKNDPNAGKWIGVGGKFEDGETPEECVLREIKEETGVTLTEFKLRGIITFCSDVWETEYMFLYTATGWTGNVGDCTEGDLKWIPIEDSLNLNLWEGDRIFLKLLQEDHPFFSLKLNYHGDTLTDYKVEQRSL